MRQCSAAHLFSRHSRRVVACDTLLCPSLGLELPAVGGMSARRPWRVPYYSEMHRNQVCTCGSGKRFKHCHGAAVVAQPLATPASRTSGSSGQDPLTTLHLALARQREGRLDSAEAMYGQALEFLPRHFDAIHMLGVVKLQLGKFEEATRLLVAALPLAPENAIARIKHNLALCLLDLARQLGALESVTAEPLPPKRPAPFGRAYTIPGCDAAGIGRISVILTNGLSVSKLQRSLDGVRVQSHSDVEIIAAIAAHTPEHGALRAALDRCGVRSRLIVADDADTLAGQVNIAAGAATGAYLCFLRAGDHWAPRWLQQMTGALLACDAQWGYGGLRVAADDGSIVRYGSSPEADALLQAQDALYVHRTASLGFLAFNPVAAGRNLGVTADLWRRLGGLAADATDPVLDWAWRTAGNEEPVYIDEPDYLIPPGTEWPHLHDGFVRMIAATGTRLRVDDAEPGRGSMNNPYLRQQLSAYWARQWRQIRSKDASALPAEILLGCAGMLGVEPADAVPPTLT
jgi:tetratricopeptide (TPR) repeat protein